MQRNGIPVFVKYPNHFPRERMLRASPWGDTSESKSSGGSGASGGSWRGRDRSLITLLERVRVDASLGCLPSAALEAGSAKGDAGSGRSAGLSLFLTSVGICWLRGSLVLALVLGRADGV